MTREYSHWMSSPETLTTGGVIGRANTTARGCGRVPILQTDFMLGYPLNGKAQEANYDHTLAILRVEYEHLVVSRTVEVIVHLMLSARSNALAGPSVRQNPSSIMFHRNEGFYRLRTIVLN